MKEKFDFSKKFVIICLGCIAIGVVAMTYGFITNPQRAWATFLLNNFYFFALAIGAAFFLAIQAITRSGWSSGFRRISEAMMLYIPIAAILFLCLFFGMKYLYSWSLPDVILEHKVVQHQSPYLNIPFFFIRMILFFFCWIVLAHLIRKRSLTEDSIGGTLCFDKIEWYSKIFIFVLAVTFSLFAFDVLMSLETGWFSTIFAFKNFMAAFVHGTATIFIIIVLLNFKKRFDLLNESHTHDFARYIFILSIFYGYFWFSQFMLIWYGNIPEETAYYLKRWGDQWQAFWSLDIIFNWAIPFFVLLPVNTSRSKWVVFGVSIISLIGLWFDLYTEIFPALLQQSTLGFIEIGSFIGFAGLFALSTGYHLSNAALVPYNHPLLNESFKHHFEPYI